MTPIHLKTLNFQCVTLINHPSVSSGLFVFLHFRFRMPSIFISGTFNNAWLHPCAIKSLCNSTLCFTVNGIPYCHHYLCLLYINFFPHFCLLLVSGFGIRLQLVWFKLCDFICTTSICLYSSASFPHFFLYFWYRSTFQYYGFHASNYTLEVVVFDTVTTGFSLVWLVGASTVSAFCYILFCQLCTAFTDVLHLLGSFSDFLII